MDSVLLKTFITVAACGNITKAAEKLGYTQSGLSHMLNRAEEELGFKLFSRSKSGVSLTKDGITLLPIAKEAERAHEKMYEAITSIQGLEKGRVTIGTFSSISTNILPPVLMAFGKDYPGINIDLMEGSISEINDWIMDHTVDVAFTSIQKSDKFEYTLWFDDPLLAILPKDFPLGEDNSFHMEDFNNYPFIMPSTEKGYDFDAYKNLKQNDLSPNIRLSSKSSTTILSMVENGLGISLLAELLVLGRCSSGVKAVPTIPYSYRTLGMGFNSLKSASPATLKFIEYTNKIITKSKF